VRPLYVPLQYIDIAQELRNAVNAYFTGRTNGAFQQSPLAREAIENGPPLVVIFDGLDELAKPGEGAAEVASLFVAKLNQLIAALRGDTRRGALYVVSGRMPSFQAARKFLSANGTKSYVAAGYRPVVKTQHIKGDPTLMARDQRQLWWSKYSSAFNAPSSLPPAMVDERFAEITNEPLLCYLLALSGYVTTDWQKAAENRNRIYAKLIEDVWARAWGDGNVKRQGPGRALTRSEFVRLMETIALAAWCGGDTRVASEERFIEATKLAKTCEIWNAFKDANGPDIGNLALNFYLKSAESEHRGFEFTHKSFGDYLLAKSICRFAFDLVTLTDRRIELAANEWLNAAGQGELTSEILAFLRDEMRLKAEADRQEVLQVKRAFEALVSHALADGFPSQIGNSISWRMAEKAQNAAEAMAWAVLSCCSRALDDEDAKICVRWPDERALSRLIARLAPLSDHPAHLEPFRQCLANLDCQGADLFVTNLRGANLSGARLDGANLSGADLCAADLSRASLKRANLQRTHLDGARLDFASLKEARLWSANTAEVYFHETEITGAVLSVKQSKKWGVPRGNQSERSVVEPEAVATRAAGVLNSIELAGGTVQERQQDPDGEHRYRVEFVAAKRHPSKGA